MKLPFAGRPRLIVAILTLWLLAPSFMAAWYIWRQGAPIAHALGTIGLPLLLLAVSLLLVRSLRRLFFIWLPAAFLVPIQCYLTWFFKSVPGAAFISSVFRAGPEEFTTTLFAFAWALPLLPLAWFVYVWLVRQLPPELRRTRPWTKAAAAWTFFYGSFGALTTAGIAEPTKELGLFAPEVIADSFPTGPLWSVATYLDERGVTYGGVPVTASAPADPAVVILIIGETLRADHLGINGYARQTTPELARIQDELISYTNVSAGANYTYISMPYIVTQRVGGGRLDISEVFKAAGFFTAWISNQEYYVYPALAELRQFANTNWRLSPHYDTELLPQIAACLNQCGSRQFITVHLLGSHFPYDRRYEPKFRRFTPVLGDGPPHFSPSERERFVNSYDNTVLATDYVVAQIIEQARRTGKPAVVAFTADHGENLYDDERERILHSGKQATRMEAIVPLVFWANDAWRRTHGAQWQALAARRSLPVAQTSVMPTLTELAGVRYTGQDETLSLAHPSFTVPHSRLIIQTDGKRVPVDTLR
ncbi:phosphoethanolamine transferase [Massilia arenosa]|uniref:Phosphoethanolamine transferase n=1 Tax=Zemynaea arenosa TaxID=2561931 RepID=A0A4Y9SIH9_9BURK|nr:phosphoethanolamine transferase [Massilia arenosa]TFW25489.1 phosphoethanolamine transferase [Massilia arenosa]